MKFTYVDEAVFLLILNEVELETVSLLLDLIVWLLKLVIEFLIRVSSFLLLFEDFAVILILISHVLRLLLNLCQLGVFFLDVSLRFDNVLFEFLIEVDKHILPVQQIFLRFSKDAMVPLDLFGE